MANPIVLKHFPVDGLPRNWYRIVGVQNITVQTTAGARARSCLVIKEQGRAGHSYYAQDRNRWVCVMWAEGDKTYPIEVDLEDDETPATVSPPPKQQPPQARPGATVVRKGSPSGQTGGSTGQPSGTSKPEIKMLAGKPYRVQDGKWTAVEVPAPIKLG